MKNKILKIMGGIIVLLLLAQPAMADLYLEQTIITDGSVNQREDIYSNGDIVSEHNLFGDGDIDLIINGVDWDPSTITESVMSIETQMESNKDSNFQGNDVSSYIGRAVSLILGELPSSNNVAESIAESLYRTFMPRFEIAEMYENIDARLAVWEKWAHLYDHERYCHAKALVAQERGYKDFHCKDDEWYHIEPDYIEGIRVEPFPKEE